MEDIIEVQLTCQNCKRLFKKEIIKEPLITKTWEKVDTLWWNKDCSNCGTMGKFKKEII